MINPEERFYVEWNFFLRYKLHLSDSLHTIWATVGPQVAQLISQKTLTKLSLIRLDEYVCKLPKHQQSNGDDGAQKKASISIMRAVVLENPMKVVGAPVPLSLIDFTSSPSSSPSPPPQEQITQQQQKKTNETATAIVKRILTQMQEGKKGTKKKVSETVTRREVSLKEEKITPIKQLNPYRNAWTIFARVIQKSDIRLWKNSKFSG